MIEVAVGVLSRWLPGARIEPKGLVNKDGPAASVPVSEFVVTSGKKTRTVVVSSLPAIRIPDLLGRLAFMAINQNITGQAGASPMILVAAKQISAKSISAVESFMAANLSGREWGLIDTQGNVRLLVPSLGLDINETSVRTAKKRPSRQSKELFSDLNRWMLKILLLRHLPKHLWGGPTGPIATPTDLARVAGVSVEMAHRFFRTFEQYGYIRRTSRGLQLLHAEAMLDSWMAAERQVSVTRTPVRRVFSKGKRLKELFSPHPETTVAAGGFEACRRFDLLHASSESLEIHVLGNWKADILNWKVEPCSPEQADLVLVHSAYPRSIEKGLVQGRDLSTVDVLQAALDVVHSSARGIEQAGFLVEHILASIPEVER